jgi:hypothetical protein
MIELLFKNYPKGNVDLPSALIYLAAVLDLDSSKPSRALTGFTNEPLSVFVSGTLIMGVGELEPPVIDILLKISAFFVFSINLSRFYCLATNDAKPVGPRSDGKTASSKS